ncbi:phosphatase YcdX [bioreactor metagenome]|uniref:Phosphatase YcdX n=1 Tax=bioreactor metagenome TaxID=1076179 RepID=A0A645JDL3_9ZZZZ
MPGGFRSGSDENIEKLLHMAIAENVPIVVGSDAHFYTGIGDIYYVERLLEKIGFPEELVLNTDLEKLLYAIKRNKRQKK